MITYSNPIAYGKRAMATDVDACNAVGIGSVTLYNGTLVTLGKINTGAAEGAGYVYPVTPTTANTAKDVWMVLSPEINREIATNTIVDPRAFEIPAGRPADLIHLTPGVDNVHVSIDSFTENYDPATVTTAVYATADADGKYKAVASASGVTGVVFTIEGEEDMPVGQEMVKAWILKCIQNPNVALV